MKLGFKRLRVIFKLYVRSLKKCPHNCAISMMALITFGLTSYVAYDTWINRNQFRVSTFSKWNEFQKQYNSRSIASAAGDVCQSSSFSAALLDQEIAQLESQYETGHYIEGNWHGVNLKSLPSVQAQLLADHGGLIGDQSRSQNFKSCRDVICVFNQIYQDHSGISGKIVYYWYLKTGSMINLSNVAPGLETKSENFREHLFTQEELRNFYILAKSLPVKFLHNPLLKSIHKFPGNLQNNSECAASLPSGQILLGQNCLGRGSEDFLLNVTNQMAKYIDQLRGQENQKIYSQTKEWLDRSLWLREELWDFRSKDYEYTWHAHVPRDNFVSLQSIRSPGEQFSRLLSHYRFKPGQFNSQVPQEIAALVKKEFYSNQSYDPSGMFEQYFKQTLKEWSRKEVVLWEDCFEKHLKPETLKSGNRDLASSMEDPLYSCVEKKIPDFVQEVVETIKKDNIEGCKFFNDHNQYGHVSKRYFDVLDKFLMEKILQRKIELKRHGMEVLTGQQAKAEFLEQVDPSSVFINCHGSSDAKSCYEKTISNEISRVLNRHRDISNYYRKIVKEDILNLFSFEEIQIKTNEVAKKFIAPFYSHIHFASKHIWETCKNKGPDEDAKISLPLQFSGGKRYVNAKLLNCVNDKMDKELYEIVNLGAFQELDEKTIEFQLNKTEKEFALTFMKGKMRQILNNILEEEVTLEKNRIASHFQEKEPQILSEFQKSGSLLDEIYSYQQVTDKCLDEMKSHYPKNYFYHPHSKVDKQYGRKICSTFIESPGVKNKIAKEVSAKWEENKKLVESYLDDYFAEEVEDCNDEYPRTLGSAYMRNSRMRKICIEEAYNFAINHAMEEWMDHKHHEYFSDKEAELGRHLYSQANFKIQRALK